MHHRRRSLTTTLVLTVALAAGLSLLSGAAAPARAGDAPRLGLSLSTPTRPGEKLRLRWDCPDPSIRELEIMMSVDGGRSYSIWLSPELDPRSRQFSCAMPYLRGEKAWVRIRFNRGGHEQEGASVELLDLMDHGCRLPDAVVPVAGVDSDPNGPARSGEGRSTATSRGPASGAEAGETAVARRPRSTAEPMARTVANESIASAIDTNAAPRFVPPRK